MARQTLMICDQCNRKEVEGKAINWIETHHAGLNVRRADEYPIDGLFCSSDCLVRYFITRHGAKTTDPFEEPETDFLDKDKS